MISTKKLLIYLLIGVLWMPPAYPIQVSGDQDEQGYVNIQNDNLKRNIDQDSVVGSPPIQRSCPSKNDNCGGGGCGGGGGGGNNPKQKATQLAQNAAKEAKAASDAQQAAGQQASHQVKSQLAEKACQANNAAQAALAGKQSLVDQIEEQIREAEAVLHEESSSQNGCQSTAQIAQQLVLEAKQQVKILAAAVQNVQAMAADADKLNEAMQDEMQGKEGLLDAAKHRIAQLGAQLSAAQQDLASTKCAANKAAAAAQQAKQNAMRNKRDDDSNRGAPS